MALGIGLRLYAIEEQILADDELHLVYGALYSDYLQILLILFQSDFSIPSGLWMKTLHDLFGLSEMKVRLFALLPGAGFLFLGPALAEKRFSKETATGFLLALAISPFLIYFSRYARPYSMALVLSFAMIFFAERWIREGSPSGRNAYAVLALLGTWIHPAMVAFFLAPIGVAATRHRREALLLGGSLVFTLFLLFVFPYINSREQLEMIRTGDAVQWLTFKGVAHLFSGTGSNGISALLCALVAFGWLDFRRLNRDLADLVLAAGLVQIAWLTVSGAWLIQVPVVFSRYALPILPFAILFGCHGLIALTKRFAPPLSIGGVRPELLLAAGYLLGSGPLPDLYAMPNNWTNHGMFQYTYRPLDPAFNPRFSMSPLRISKFYRDLGKEPAGTYRILETPWFPDWPNNPLPLYQQTHRQFVAVGSMGRYSRGGPFGDFPPIILARNDFRHYLHLSDLEGLRKKGIDFVVFHKNLPGEIPKKKKQAQLADPSKWIRDYKMKLGEAFFEDQDLVVFRIRPPESRKPRT